MADQSAVHRCRTTTLYAVHVKILLYVVSRHSEPNVSWRGNGGGGGGSGGGCCCCVRVAKPAVKGQVVAAERSQGPIPSGSHSAD